MSVRAQEDAVALTDILLNAARELEALAGKASAIDEVVGDMIVTSSDGGTPISIALLQDVDLLRQTVDCLHILLDNLSREHVCTCAIPRDQAGAGIYLARLRSACLGE